MNELNLNASSLAGLSAMQFQTEMQDVGGAAKETAGRFDALSVSVASAAPFEGLEEIPEALLTRNDELGERFHQAFNLAAPPPPPFVD